jgi:hypothetical protein
MRKELEQVIINISGILVIPDSKPECLRIIEASPIPILKHSLVKEGGIVIQGVIENTIEYVFNCPKEQIEKSQCFKSKIHFARFMGVKNLKAYSKIDLRVYLEWKEFSLLNPRHIKFFLIVGGNPVYRLKSEN